MSFIRKQLLSPETILKYASTNSPKTVLNMAWRCIYRQTAKTVQMLDVAVSNLALCALTCMWGLAVCCDYNSIVFVSSQNILAITLLTFHLSLFLAKGFMPDKVSS